MKFSYEWNDELLARACHELEIVQLKELYWRKERQRASLAAVASSHCSRRSLPDRSPT